jgi:hypothetical protein
MWSTEEFGAVSGRRQQAALRPPIFLSLTPRFGSNTPLTSSGFCRLLSTFLPGSASQVEIAVTYSKQRTAQILPGSRIAHKRSSDQPKFSSEFFRGAQAAVHGSRLPLATSLSLALTKKGTLACPDEGRATSFLTETASHSKTTVTNSKQTAETFLTGARTAHKRSSNRSKFSAEFVRGARLAIQGSRFSLATSHSLALTKEGPLATAFRYNAPCPNFSCEARNLN